MMTEQKIKDREAEKAKRLQEALRENLKRRKEQQRQRKDAIDSATHKAD
jgi:DNA-binding helix-hairpin-helix protein with protein kinase domain